MNELEPPSSDVKGRRMSVEEAVQILRADPRSKQVIEDSYLSGDVHREAERFLASAEFGEVRELVGPLEGRSILDLGAGTGIAAWAFSTSGAGHIYALEPDPSPVVGRGAISEIADEASIQILASTGEDIPLEDETIDVVFSRQVLHHVGDMKGVLTECARVLRNDGILIASREHVVDDERELAEFLAGHPIHALAGGEHARPLHEYTEAITSAGLKLRHVIGPWESVTNAYPTVKSAEELSDYPRAVLKEKFGPMGDVFARIPGVPKAARYMLAKRIPGRMYSFVAIKP